MKGGSNSNCCCANCGKQWPNNRMTIRPGNVYFCNYCRTESVFIKKESIRKYDRERALSQIQELKEAATKNELGSTNTTVDEKDFLKNLVELSNNAYILEKQLEELLIKKADADRTIHRIEGEAIQKYISNYYDTELDRIENELSRADRIDVDDIERIEKELGLKRPELTEGKPTPPKKPNVSKEKLVEPQKPIPKAAGLFNKSKVELLNRSAEEAYKQDLIQYQEAVKAWQAYEKEKVEYDRNLLPVYMKAFDIFEEENRAYDDRLNAYRDEYVEKKRAALNNERDSIYAEIDSHIKNKDHLSELDDNKKKRHYSKVVISEFFSEEVSEIKQMLLEQYKLIKSLESTGIIFPKYNDVIAWNTMYEYFLTGRVSSLSGPNGAYNLYESELRSNTIISKLDTVIEKLDIIKDTQYLLYQLVNETNNSVKSINDYIESLTAKVEKIGDESIARGNSIMNELKGIRESSEGIAYNTAKTARNTDIIAKTNVALAYMEAIWG